MDMPNFDIDGYQENVIVDNNARNESGMVTGWQGMTINDILNKNDLFNCIMLGDNDYNKQLEDIKKSVLTSDSKVT